MNLRVFAQNLFARCALLKPLKGYYETLFSNFRAYKGKIPVCGCVLLDATMSQVVLSETKVSCAARECLEETGFDVGELDEQQAIEIINHDATINLGNCLFPLDKLPAGQWNVDKFVPRIKRMVKTSAKIFLSEAALDRDFVRPGFGVQRGRDRCGHRCGNRITFHSHQMS
ncbi:hypothetical protein CTAYLR_009822 [Chrysophaeum taylorii]|uniref:Nudix hydrolase domain-containing protein n=1 Tax=Chrysophaeum taylorii TaxID=2483200 RepID=A0AAD7UB29_9STRA|nr:hypothetical protein CTAYLR_009822 [Chrysophaeum taylorii]